MAEPDTCDLCQGGSQPIYRGVCEKCRRDKMAEIFEVAHDQLMVMDFHNKDVQHQNEIDSAFYFRVFCDRWIEGVKALRRRFFGRVDPPHAVGDPDFTAHLPDPFRHWGPTILRRIDRLADRFDDEVRLDADSRRSLASIKRPHLSELVGWWRLVRLGEPYGLHPRDVWQHLITGEFVRLPYLSYELGGAPSVLTVRIYDPAAVDYRDFGLPEDDPVVQWFWKPKKARKRRRTPQASQEAAHLIRTWTTYCLQGLAIMPARRAISEWDEAFGEFANEDLSWPLTGEEMYRQDKQVLRQRLRLMFHFRRLKPGTILSTRRYPR